MSGWRSDTANPQIGQAFKRTGRGGRISISPPSGQCQDIPAALMPRVSAEARGPEGTVWGKQRAGRCGPSCWQWPDGGGIALSGGAVLSEREAMVGEERDGVGFCAWRGVAAFFVEEVGATREVCVGLGVGGESCHGVHSPEELLSRGGSSLLEGVHKVLPFLGDC